MIVLVMIALLNLVGSEVVNSITGLMAGTVGLTYAISIGCVLHRRLFGAPLPYARWSLGRMGPAVNAIALLYQLYTTIISFFPLFSAVTVSVPPAFDQDSADEWSTTGKEHELGDSAL